MSRVYSAKIAGIKMAEAYRSQYGADFISVMPTNLYGPGDNYHPEYSHVVAALIRRFHEAKVSGAADVVVWGTGTPRREFLYVDDLADADDDGNAVFGDAVRHSCCFTLRYWNRCLFEASLRGAKRRSNPSIRIRGAMDCFASLAMTGE